MAGIGAGFMLLSESIPVTHCMDSQCRVLQHYFSGNHGHYIPRSAEDANK